MNANEINSCALEQTESDVYTNFINRDVTTSSAKELSKQSPRDDLTNEPNKHSSRDGLIKGASLIALGSLVSKILGAFYRIPLTTLLGAEGLSIYQTVFPIYCILLTFSSTGVPTALAKLISSGYGEKMVLRKSLSVFLPLGFLGSLLMILLSLPLSSLQGNANATLAYVALAPSVLLVSAISCIRGYFQGKMNMLPTAVSQITEQAIKLLIGLILCSVVKGSPAVLGAMACLAVTFSEVIALAYLTIVYKKGNYARITTFILPIKRLIGTLIPITLSTILLPIARVFDSFTIVNILKLYTPNASSLYGVYTGSVESVSGVPVALCYGLAVAVLPTIANLKSKGDVVLVKENIKKTLCLTLFVSTILGLGLFAFSSTITNVLFYKLESNLKSVTSSLISASFFTVIGLSLLQTLTSCLVAIGKPYAPCIFLTIGLIFKFALQLILLKIPEINIFAGLYSDIVCYFVAVFLNLLYIITILKTKREKTYENNVGRNRQSI